MLPWFALATVFLGKREAKLFNAAVKGGFMDTKFPGGRGAAKIMTG